MACPPVPAPSCREDQFLVEVRSDKSCCYSYLCGKFLNQKVRVKFFGVRPICHASNNYTNKTEFVFVFSVWAVCESCIEPIPTCSHEEILAVDLNTTNSCCPQYHCGKCGVRVCVYVLLSSEVKFILSPIVAVCDVNLCPESSVSCAPGLSLVQTSVPGHCCPTHHCGTHPKRLTQLCTSISTHQLIYILFVSGVCWEDDWNNLRRCYACHILEQTTFFLNLLSFTPRMPVWGQLSAHLSGGK